MLKTFLLYNKKTNHEEYVNEENVMDYLYLGLYKLPNLSIRETQELKDNISKISIKFPLYDIYTSNMYLIEKNNLFKAVFDNNYRFPTNKLLRNLEVKYNENKEFLKENPKNDDIMIRRFQQKYKLMIEFMDNFNIDILLNTYIKAMYDNKDFGKSLTLCKKSSFTPAFKHIRPYFTRNELLCIGLNNKILSYSELEKDWTNISSSKLNEICDYVQNNMISYKELIKHHNFIINNSIIGLVQFYTLQGSYIFNEYLRNNNDYNCNYINNLIYSLSEYIFKAPQLNNDIYVYRFIDNDSFLRNLKIGDEYTEKGFLSCTRNNFYKVNINNNTFGWYLLKIKLPKKFKYLCIETISNFPKEEEIILPPNTTFKLKSNNKNTLYYHPNKEIQDKFLSIYECEITKQEHIKFNKNIIDKIPKTIINYKNYNNIETINNYSNRDLIINYIINETNDFNLFNMNIGKKNIIMMCEEYNSIDVYKPFYAIKTDKGFNIYCFDSKKNVLLFNIEINEYVMFINYNVKYISDSYIKYFNDLDFIDFICKLSLKFNIQKVIYYCDYIYCTNLINKKDIDSDYNIGASYNYNIYNYLKFNKKKFNNIKGKFKPFSAFNYEMLDLLYNINPLDILKSKNKFGQDNLVYQNFINLYNEQKNKDKLNCKDFFIWLVENKCGLVDDFIMSLDNIDEFKNYNPFSYDYYIFYPMEFMIEHNIINKNPYLNLFSLDDINNERNRFSRKRLRRFFNNSNKKYYKTKNKLLLNDKD